MSSPYRKHIRQIVRFVGLSVVARYRRMCRDTTFIAITGSSGKTTTKRLIEAAVATRGPVVASVGSRNAAGEIAKTLLRIRRRHKFCVQEVGAGVHGALRELADVFQPDIAVVTCVNREHYGAYRTVESVADEKASLVRSLTPGGWAILNRDDAHCRAMAEMTDCRVLFFGESPEADLRAENVRAEWPDRLTFTATYRGEKVEVTTRLVGRIWTTSVLAAIGAGIATGVSLADAAAAVAKVEPYGGRMSPVEINGVTYMRDDWKNPAWSVPHCLEFLKEARAERRILILGQISDTPRRPSKLYPQTLAKARKAADIVIMTGEWAHKLKEDRHTDGVTALSIETVREIDEWLSRNIRPGDLILLRGSGTNDHLERIVYHRQKPIACWRHQCGYVWQCEECRFLYRG